MKRVLSFFLAAAMLLTLFTVPALADAGSVIESIGAANGHGAYWLYDFTKEGKAQQLIGSPSIYECMPESELSAQTDGLKITSDSVANNGVAFYDMPAGELYAKITYKFDSAALTEYAANDLTGAASFVVDGETVVDFAALSAAKGSKEVKAASLDGAQISNGAFATSVVKLSVTSGGSVLLSPTYLGDNTVKSEFTVARIALFANLADAEAFDTSASAVTVEGVTAEFDPFTHTAEVELAQDKTEADMMFAPTAYTFDLTAFGEEVNALSDSAEVTETNDALVSSMKFEVIGTDGKATAYTVNAVSKFSGNVMPENMLDFSVYGNATAAIENGTVAKTDVDQSVLDERNVDYGGTGLEMNTVDASQKKYTQAIFKFEKADVTKTYYAKIAYMLSNVSMPSGYNADYVGHLFSNWYENDNSNRVYSDDVKWTSSSLPDDYAWKTTVLKVNPSTKSLDKANKQLQICFNGLTCKAVIKYIALFESRTDAENFDPSVMNVKIDGKRAMVDPYNHTATLTVADDLSEDDVPSFTAGSVEMKLYNSDVDNAASLGRLKYPSNTTAEAMSAESQTFVEPQYRYSEIKYKIVDSYANEIIWNIRIVSNDTSYVPPVEPLALVDYTKSGAIADLVSPSASREVGTVKVGATNAVYIKTNLKEGVLDNWCNVVYDQSKVDASKKVYVKVAYRFGDDAYGIDSDQQKEFHIEFGPGGFNKQEIFGKDNIPGLRGDWRVKTFECQPRTGDKALYIGTFGIFGKLIIKYVAIFETEEDAANWRYGDVGAEIATDGTAVSVNYINAETQSFNRVYAVYKDGKLVKTTVTSADDCHTIDGLEPGTYTVKAFAFKRTDTLKPIMKSVEETITIQ